MTTDNTNMKQKLLELIDQPMKVGYTAEMLTDDVLSLIKTTLLERIEKVDDRFDLMYWGEKDFGYMGDYARIDDIKQILEEELK